MGVRDSIYVVTFDPLPSGHVTRRMRDIIFVHEHVMNNAWQVDRAKQQQAVDIWHSARYRQTRTAQIQIFAKRGVA